MPVSLSKRRSALARLHSLIEQLEIRVMLTTVGPFDNSTPLDIPVGNVKPGDQLTFTVDLSTTDPNDQAEGEPLILQDSAGDTITVSNYGEQDITMPPVTQANETYTAYIQDSDGDEQATIDTNSGSVDIERVWTTDSKSVMVQYDVEDNPTDTPFPLGIFRSDSPDSDSADEIQVATAMLSAADASEGDHTITISPSGGTYNFSVPKALRPDPDYNYVVAEGDYDGTLSDSDETTPPSDSFRIWLVGAVTHGYTFDILNQLFPSIISKVSPQTWVNDYASQLVSSDGYDEAIAFHWEQASIAKQTGETAIAGSDMADAILDPSSQPDDGNSFNVDGDEIDPSQDDVVDVNLIGHSRGGIVISFAAQDLGDSGDANFDAGLTFQTMIDPHPANNSFGNLYYANFFGRNLPIPAIFSLRSAVGRYKKFQSFAQDPSAFVASNTDAAVELYQQSPSGFLNLWGEDPDTIIENSPSGAELDSYEFPGQTHSGIVSEFGNLIASDSTLSILGYPSFDSDPLTLTTPPPSTVSAGTPFSITVTAENDDSSVNTSFNGLITVSSGDGNTLGGTLTVDAVNGVATFSNLTDNKAGSDYLDFSTPTLSDVYSDYFTINPGPVAALAIQGPNGTGANNVLSSPFGLDVNADHAYGNMVPSFSGNVTLALGNNPGASTLSGTLTVAASGGQASFSGLSVNNLGTGYTLVATNPGLTSSTSIPFSISDSLNVDTAPPSTVTAGVPFGLVVEADAGQENVDTSYNGPVNLTLSNYSGTSQRYKLNGTLTEDAINGIATFSGLTENLAGSFGLVISGTNLSSTSVLFTVAAAPATQLVATTVPARVTAQSPFDIQFSAEDAFGNIDTTYFGSVTLSLLTAPGGSIVSSTSVNAYSGVADFSGNTLSTGQSGYIYQATASGLTTGNSSPITVTPTGTATHLVVTTDASGGTAGQAFSIVIQAEDDNGTLDPNFSGTVSLSLSNGLVSTPLQGTTSVAAVGGVATFNDLVVDLATSGYTLTATSAGLTPVNTSSFTISPASASQLIISGPPGQLITNAAFSVTVTAEDPFGNIDTSFNNEIDLALASNPGAAQLGGSFTGYASSGVASFTNLTVNAQGQGYSITASANNSSAAVTPVTSAPFSVANDQLEFTSAPPISTTPNLQFSLAVAEQNSTGSVDMSFNGPVTLSLDSFGGSASLAGTLTVSAVNGTANFTGLSLTHAGRYSISASASGAGLVTAPVTVVATPAMLAVVVQPPANLTVGAPFAVTVQAQDLVGDLASTYSGSVMLSLTGGTGGAVLGGSTTVTFTNGVATLSRLTVSAVGNGYALTASSGSLTSASSSSFNVLATGVATRLVITTPPANPRGGAAFGVTVTAEDDLGNTDSSFSGPVTVDLSNNLFSGALSGTLTVNAVNGVAAFTGLSVYQAGTYAISAGAASLNNAAAAGFSVGAPPATILVVQDPASAVLTNGAFTITVDAEDALGTLDTSYNGTISLALNPAAGASLGGTASVTAVNGVATFSGLTISAAGGGDILTATASGLTAGQTSPFAVENDQLAFTFVSANPIAGQGFGLIVQAENAAGAIDTSFNGEITLTPSTAPDGTQPVLGGTYTRPALAGAAAFFGLTLNEAGAYTIQASSPQVLSGVSNSLNVAGGKATHLGVSSQPATAVTASASFDVQITAEDALGNPDASFNGPVTIAIASGSGTLGGTLTVNAVNGVADFSSLTISAPGAFTLSADGDGFNATTSPVTITATGVATTLTISTDPPATVAAGGTFGVTVQAVDAFGTFDSSYSGPVTISEVDGATLNGTLTVNAVNGVATFSGLSLNASGFGYSLMATAPSLAASDPSDSFDVTPGTATQFVIGDPSGNLLAGVPFGLTVFAEDALGNVDPTYAGPVTVSISGASGQTLGGTTTVDAVNGVAAFSNLMLGSTISGGTISASGGSLSGSSALSIAADQLVVTSPPPDELAVNAPFNFSVSAITSSGAVDNNFSGTVTISLVDYQGTGAALAGTLSVTAVNGVAKFTGMSVNIAGAYGLSIVGTNVQGTTAALAVQPASQPASSVLPAFGKTKLPSSLIAGQKISISLPLAVKASKSLTGKFVVYLYADTVSTLDGTQTLLETFTLKTSVRAAQTHAWSLRLTSLPKTLPAGTYHLLAEIVDPAGATSLVSTTATIQVVAPVIDLAVSVGALSPRTVAGGKSGSVLLTITNTGNINATGLLEVMLAASYDQTSSGIVSLLATQTSRVNLAPNHHLSIRVRFKAPKDYESLYPFTTVSLAGVAASAAGSVAGLT